MKQWWLREAISDTDGLADMAYIAIGSLTCAAIAALVFIFALSAIDYAHCMPTTTVQTSQTEQKGDGKSKDEKSVHLAPCRFDPLPVGQSAGLIFGAFGALIGALAGYMAATRRPPRVDPPKVP